MEQAQSFQHIAAASSEVRGKRGEWDLNGWNWDGDLFIATPSGIGIGIEGHQFIPVVGPGNSSNTTSSSCSDEVYSGGNGNGIGIEDERRQQMDRKRGVVVVEGEPNPNNNNNLDEAAASLALKLGTHTHGYHPPQHGIGNGGWEAKKTKLAATGTGTRGACACQVEDCGADLTKAKDYHRRHKVCELHSKATKALVANVMQRFCQQCSRFHVLQEFDEGKRSCRRRLAGHNKRRRKTQPDATTAAHAPNSVNDDHTNGVLLISLLRILSTMHANKISDQTADQDLLAQLLKSLANPSQMPTGKNMTGLLHESQKLLNGGGMPDGHSEKISAFLSNDHQNPSRVIDQHLSLPGADVPRKGLDRVGSKGAKMQGASSPRPGIAFPVKDNPVAYAESNTGRMKLNNFDLNDTYVDSDDGMEDLERSPANGNITSSPDFPSWAGQDSHQSSPPQTSGNSDSGSAQSPSSSSSETQSRTDRIVFKLFGKEPSDFPVMMRGKILDWLAHSPTDIESYIRPGCIILTIYLRLADSLWEELCSDLSSSLTRLFDMSDDNFWRTGWIYVRVQNQIAVVDNGQIVLDTSLPFENSKCGRILSVVPIAVSIAEQVHFKVRGSNLSQSTTRLLCALEGKYIDQGEVQKLEDSDNFKKDEDSQIEHASISCSMPNMVGRGFIEAEVHDLSSSFFPFIIAETDVCSEIRMLEDVLDLNEADEVASGTEGNSVVRHQALDFINEMGWLLHRSHLKSRLGHLDPNTVIFSFRRFKWLVDFAMNHDWCAVVKKLLDISVMGAVGSGEQPSLKLALSEMGLLHRAVRRNCRSMVELLLRYTPLSVSKGFESTPDGDQESLLFTPNALGPAGLTPLHVAAGRDGSEDILDALTDDPGKIGIQAWKNARDSTGATPEDYARLRGHYAYIHLVQRKINGKPRLGLGSGSGSESGSGHVVLDIPRSSNVMPKEVERFEIVGRSSSVNKQSCKLCDQKMTYYYGGSRTSSSYVYRPAMLSMVAIAAVCVCMALMFRGMPSVVCVFSPFRWEMMDYGSS